MKTRLFAGILAVGLSLAPLSVAAEKEQRNSRRDSDMARAIAFERHKEMAAARQARREARHPSVSNAERRADREMNDNSQGRRVKDPGPGSIRH